MVLLDEWTVRHMATGRVDSQAYATGRVIILHLVQLIMDYIRQFGTPCINYS